MGKQIFKIIVFLACLATAGAAALVWWIYQPLALATPSVELTLERQSEANAAATKSVAQQIVEAGVQTQPALLQLWFRISGDAKRIKAGTYEFEAGTTPSSLLNKLVTGAQSLQSVTLVEGWSFAQVRDLLSKAERLRHDTQGLSDDDIMDKLGRTGVKAEGRFFPDTYTFARGSSDLAVLRLALQAMDKNLEAAWAMRLPDSPLKTPDEALILASIVEKETGKETERALVGSVFNNRLKIGMPLQTDPTVIYGVSLAKGAPYDGNWLRARADDNPWNTYLHKGLPATPIAMPGKAALLAAVQPASSTALYFVAKGDDLGSSQFSATLEEHNQAVNQYIRDK